MEQIVLVVIFSFFFGSAMGHIFFTNVTVNMTMRDGVFLGTYIVFPSLDGRYPPEKLPARYEMTPYCQISEGITTNAIKQWEEGLKFSRFVLVLQCSRGGSYSDGVWDGFTYARQDAEDTIRWVINQPWSNGIIVPTGISAMGIAAYESAAAGLAIGKEIGKRVIGGLTVGWATPNMYNLTFRDGLFTVGDTMGYAYLLNYSGVTGAGASASNARKHEAPGDPYWLNTSLSLQDYKDTDWVNLQFAAWYDLFQGPQLHGWKKYVDNAGKAVEAASPLLVGLAGHCFAMSENSTGIEYYHLNQTAVYLIEVLNYYADQLLMASFGNATTKEEYDTALIKWKFLTSYIAKPFIWYVSGPPVNGSDQYAAGADQLPHPTYHKFYIGADNQLTRIPITNMNGSHNYTYDPADPIRTVGGANLGYLVNMTCGPANTDKLAARSDMLRFTAAPFIAKYALTGSVQAVLQVSTDVPDTDFMVKLIDVFPNGTRWQIMDGGIRMRWRLHTSKPALLTPAHIYNITIDLWALSYIFLPGHSLGIDIQSSNYPSYTVNPNTGIPLDQPQQPNRTAHNAIHWGRNSQSYISIPHVPLSALPRFYPHLAARNLMQMKDDEKSMTEFLTRTTQQRKKRINPNW